MKVPKVPTHGSIQAKPQPPPPPPPPPPPFRTADVNEEGSQRDEYLCSKLCNTQLTLSTLVGFPLPDPTQ